MDIQDVVALIIVTGAVYYVTRSLWRTLGSSNSNGCNCSHKKSEDKANRDPHAKPRDLIRTPLVPVDQIGIPTSNQPEAEKIDK